MILINSVIKKGEELKAPRYTNTAAIYDYNLWQSAGNL
jgi:hypothetical protein